MNVFPSAGAGFMVVLLAATGCGGSGSGELVVPEVLPYLGRNVLPDDGALVLDRNRNGVIEPEDLFAGRSVGRDVDNPFEDLALFDMNGDGVINDADPDFAELRVWKDMNGDGAAQPGELLTMAEAGVAEINLAYRDNDDDAIRQIGTYKKLEEEGYRSVGGLKYSAEPLSPESLVLDLDGHGWETRID